MYISIYIYPYTYIYIYIHFSPLIARYELYHTPKQLITNLSHDCPSTSA